jgi:tetratricopeptide (TPR) repeat protein
VLTVLQGALRPAAVEGFANIALARFPGEPRFVLARAIAADQRTALAGRSAGREVSTTLKNVLDNAQKELEAASALPTVEPEARIRLAHLLFRRGMPSEALAQLKKAEAAGFPDPAIRFLNHLFHGHVLSALSRDGEAIAAYRAAVDILPTAHSARVALMNALFKQGDRAQAEALAEHLQSTAPSGVDPWWLYWQGQYRL